MTPSPKQSPQASGVMTMSQRELAEEIHAIAIQADIEYLEGKEFFIKRCGNLIKAIRQEERGWVVKAIIQKIEDTSYESLYYSELIDLINKFSGEGC